MTLTEFEFQDIIEAANDVIVVTKAAPISAPGPEIVYVNKAFTELTGYSFEEAVGHNPRMLQSKDTDPETRAKVRDALKKQEPVRVTIKNFSKAGRAYWLDMSILPLRNAAGEVTHFAAIERDVTDSKELEMELDLLSRSDPLSGLLNRRAFDHVIGLELGRFRGTGNTFSILALDIDHFKRVNDQFGHPAGDCVIQSVAKHCSELFDSCGHVARTGGEEFIILLPDTDAPKAMELAETLRHAIEQDTVETDAGTVDITISIGVAQVDLNDEGALPMISRADRALYQAKSEGRNRVCVDDTVSFGSVC